MDQQIEGRNTKQKGISDDAQIISFSRQRTGPLHDSTGRISHYKYRAFISYSHKADNRFAPTLQSAIEQLGKPLLRRRALDIFRDDTDLAISPELWPKIHKALNDSEYFLLLACPEAAASDGVQREVSHWINVLKRDSHKVLIAVTSGKLVWNEDGRDFDWSQTTSLPAAFKEYFRGHPEPLWADFCDCKTEDRQSLEDATFRQAAVKLAAGLHGVAPRDLESEDLRQHRRTVRIFTAFVTGLILLLIGALMLFFDARHQRKEAQTRERIAQSRALAVQAMDRSDKRLEVALLLSAESHRIADTLESRKALVDSLMASPYIYRFLDGAGGVASLAFHPGRAILVAASGSSILAWDTGANKPPLRLRENGETFESVRFIDSGAVLAAATKSGRIILWDFDKGKPIVTLAADNENFNLSSPAVQNGSLFSVIAPSGVLIWDIRERAVRSIIPVGDDPVMRVTLSPSGDIAAVAHVHSGIRLWDVVRNRYRQMDLAEHSGHVTALAFSPDGHILASGGEDQKVILLDVTTGSQRELRGHGWVSQVQFSPDARFLAWGSFDGYLDVFDLTANRPLMLSPLKVDSGVGALAFSFDSQKMAVGGQAGGQLFELDLTHESRIATVRPAHDEWIVAIAFSPEGDLVASASRDGELILWDARQRTIRSRSRINEKIEIGACMEFSPDSKLLITCMMGGKAIVWRVDSTSATASSPVAMETGAIRSAVFRPDGKVIASGGRSGSVFLSDVANLGNSKPMELAAVGCQISVLEFNPKGDAIAVGCTDGKIYLIDAKGRQSGFTGGVGNVVSGLKFSPSGDLLYSASSEGVMVWNVKSHSIIGTPLDLEGSGASQIAISRDGGMIASASRHGSIALWDARRRVLIGNLPSHGDSFFSVAFAPSGKFLAAGSGFDMPVDNAMMFWDLDPTVWMQAACAIAGRNLRPEEWLRYAGEETVEETCPNGPGLR